MCILVQNQMAISCGSRAHLEKDSIAKVCFPFLLYTVTQNIAFIWFCYTDFTVK